MRIRWLSNASSQSTYSKKATNLSLDSELLAEARRFNTNLSATMEKALEQEVKARQKAEWLEQNTDAIDACNDVVSHLIRYLKNM